jgi:hypothetical protein
MNIDLPCACQEENECKTNGVHFSQCLVVYLFLTGSTAARSKREPAKHTRRSSAYQLKACTPPPPPGSVPGHICSPPRWRFDILILKSSSNAASLYVIVPDVSPLLARYPRRGGEIARGLVWVRYHRVPVSEGFR